MVDVSVVVLTMGDRPQELADAIGSARDQAGVSIEVVLVVNGGTPDTSIADVVVEPGENLGIPGGRNAGADASNGTLVCFLDDDGALADGVLAPALEAFTANDRLAVIGLRVVDPSGATARRHVPGLRSDADTSRAATSFPGGASIVRRTTFDQVGGLCGPFRYGLEETDLAWRLLDAGWDIQYRADLQMTHPRTSPTRHKAFFVDTARNRVWLAHRTLPIPLAVVYVTAWTLVTTARNLRRPGAIIAHLRGTAVGLRGPIGPRRPMRWRTVWKMARLGRPPVI